MPHNLSQKPLFNFVLTTDISRLVILFEANELIYLQIEHLFEKC